nr:hypothetical protein [candidate division Zixibacteria bacterium]
MVSLLISGIHIGRMATAGLLSCFLLMAGCSTLSTQRGFYKPITAELEKENYDGAVAAMEKARQEDKFAGKDRFLYYIDAGLLYHYAVSYDSSNARLNAAEQAADELYARSLSRAAASLLLNDNVLEYAGEDYEILYSNLIKTLNYLELGKFEDAFVEVRRANEKLNLLEQKYRDMANKYEQAKETDSIKVDIKYEAREVRFNNDAFARYLSMHMYAAEGKFDDARIDRDYLGAAFAEQPHIYDFPEPDVRFVPEDKNKTILSVIGLAGLAPVKEPLNLRLRTDKNLDLVQILYTNPWRKNTEYGHIPMKISEDYYFKFAIPVIVRRASNISRIRVLADGVFIGELQLLEDVAAVAGETFEAKRFLIYLRTVARAVAKGLITHRQKEKVDDGKAGGWLAKLAIDAVTDISENADLRSAQYLPGKIYVGDFEMAPGKYDLTIEFINPEGHVLGFKNIDDYIVSKTTLNMVEARLLK